MAKTISWIIFVNNMAKTTKNHRGHDIAGHALMSQIELYPVT